MKKQSLIRGSIILGVAGILTRFLGLFFRWPLIMLIGDEGIGYYQMSYPLYMFFIAMASGVPVAISKMISEKNATNDIYGSFEVMKESAILMTIIGTGTTLALFFFAKPIVLFLKWDPKAYYSLIGISFAPIVISFVTIFRGFFQGLQNMTPSAISQIIEQIGRVIFGVGLAVFLLPRGIEYSAGGAAFGATAGAVLGGAYLYSNYKRVKKRYAIKKIKSNPEILNTILKIAIPISLGTTVSSIMNLIDSILVPQKLLDAGFTNVQSTVLYAQLTGKASVIVNIPLTLSMAICTSLIPIIAENFILKKQKELKSKIDASMKMASVIAIPCTFGLFFLAEPVMKFIFPGRFEGIEILKYLSLTIPFIIITQTTTAILQGTGHYIKPVINLLIGCLIKIVLTWVLVPMQMFNIYGAVLASFGAYLTVSILNIVMMKFTLRVRLNLYEILIKPCYASSIMMLIVLISYNILYKNTISNGISCLTSIFLGMIVYIIMIIVFKVFNVEEIRDRFKRK
ncbi:MULTISPECIES: putative polysaccharide biosynthesis protein [Clostridium]|jgi:Membrane protein involved in the export of O-antigen and teichoic acid|uniref:Polysaccharide biosynthesis protein n=2 Tax=Clostridium beijerinckii TaxID=1520 RepID=A0AAE2UZV4_CLOBE|nr:MULTISPECIES: polysaccharide biosynthesis protein [Clostridium]ABR32279.1 polysaccharide biosynthesis protein [Clostridium beijerinckii NCIMB 8052]AIU02831.1 polysaccharide biosynthesis protein [Clostridium beijerinckii ATCC 35702]MBE6090292.1 polysaccharide biosynthesis protein [Clostridium beijerinckii]MBF7808043.1 polysaccharide biosynthesis protein [Clostridium beijerinckii]NRT21606.1 stage V sporulation protein B [Clostridium beijerinckii]